MPRTLPRLALVLSLLGCRADAAAGAAAGEAGSSTRERLRALGGERAPVSSFHWLNRDQAFVLRESGLREPTRVVVRDSASWAALWASMAHFYHGSPGQPRPPRVDFRREMVIVAGRGTSMPMGAYRMAVLGAVRRGDTLVVAVRSVGPVWPHCGGRPDNDGADAPVAIARAPRHAGPVAFAEDGVNPPCSPWWDWLPRGD